MSAAACILHVTHVDAKSPAETCMRIKAKLYTGAVPTNNLGLQDKSGMFFTGLYIASHVIMLALHSKWQQCTKS